MKQGGWVHQNCLSLHRICLKGTTTCGECAQTAWKFFLGEPFFKENILRGFHCILGTTGMCHQAHNITPTKTDMSQTHTHSTKNGEENAAHRVQQRIQQVHALQRSMLFRKLQRGGLATQSKSHVSQSQEIMSTELISHPVRSA